MKSLRTWVVMAAASCIVFGSLMAGESPWTEIPQAQWKGATKAEVPALKLVAAAAIALPEKETKTLSATSAATLQPGVYEIRLTLRPSHASDAIAFNSGLRIKLADKTVAEFPGKYFIRPHQPETRILQAVQTKAGPLMLNLEAFSDANIAEKSRTSDGLKKGGPKIDKGGDDLMAGDKDSNLDLELEFSLSPDKAVYYLVDKIEFRPLSHSGLVDKVDMDKIRYLPGTTLKGTAIVADIGGKGGNGTLNIYLEHNVKDRVKVKSIPVTLKPEPQTISFEIPLPKEELGYALVAEYVSADGSDISEAAEYFNIAANFQRVAIFGGGLATRDAVLDDETIRNGLMQARADYFNATEYFAWAEDDMVAMSPKTDFWSSGQTNYRMNKETIQRQIKLAHEQGVAVATYGKFCMSGLQGWETAYDYPNDHRNQYSYPVGMWEGVNAGILDRRRDKDFTVYGKSPNVSGNPFRNWWSEFMPINPNASPRMVRIAAEECARSVDMFGWDAIRWDGHPRAGWNACGQSGKYEAWSARQTQALVRYFKEIIASKYPDFRHGYNYFLIEPDKKYDWAKEDFELDELARGGGLLMNESIGNASAGWTFESIARNLQVDGDLSRERGGCYLGISFAKSPRDIIIESALWAAAGCRPYNTSMNRETRRYCTRYSQYTFDENLRRMVAPEKLLSPQSETKLWWQPFVYETPLADGKRQLVVNLLNLSLQEKRPNNRDGNPKPVWDMPPATEPVTFALTLPTELHATGVNLIDPRTLAVTQLPLKDNKFEVPSVVSWSVLVIDLMVDAGAPSLASLYGAPKTFGVPRSGVKDTERKAEIVLDPKIEIWEVNRRMGELAPEWEVTQVQEQAALDALSCEARDKALLARRKTVEELTKEWWKGAAIPADLAFKDKKPAFGDLTPHRNGRFDIFYGRGAMDYRLRMPAAFARLDRFQVHDAPLWGSVRQSPGMGMSNNVSWRQYPDFDVLLFTGIPHCAIGIENNYALVDYVKAGGSAFFTGGEYAFGKGGYMYTVLERELLPLQCTAMLDTVYPEKPQAIEPGPNFDELKIKADFTARPSFWVRNEVVLKPGAKVFLKSGDRPILVGWQLGKGRVACLLVDYRGKSEKDVTAFFDWRDWPVLVEGVLRWLAPEADQNSTATAEKTNTDAKAILNQLRGTGTDDALADLEKTDTGTDLPGGDAPKGTRELKGDALKQRISLIDRALAIGGTDVAAALAEQLVSVKNLSLDTRLRIFTLLQREHPAAAAAAGRSAVSSQEGVIKGNSYVLLSVAGEPEFTKQVTAPQAIAGESEAAKQERLRDLAMAVVLYAKPDLLEEGRRQVEAWNKKEAAVRAEFAKVCGADTAILETSPYLDAESIFARLAWLAYLSRHEPNTYAAPFLHEWLMSMQYLDYCWRSSSFIIEQQKLTGAKAEAVSAAWSSLAARFDALQNLTRPDVDKILANSPAEAGATLSKARFDKEVRTLINLLGDMDRNDTAGILEALAKSSNSDLATFAAARKMENK